MLDHCTRLRKLVLLVVVAFFLFSLFLRHFLELYTIHYVFADFLSDIQNHLFLHFFYLTKNQPIRSTAQIKHGHVSVSVCALFFIWIGGVMHLCVRYFSAHRSLAEAKLNMQLICIYWHVCDVDFNMKNRTQYFYMRTHHAHIIMNQKPRENTKHTKFCAETVIYISFNR